MAKNHKKFITIGSISAAVAVALGAFGSHSLSSTLSQAMYQVYSTAFEYQMYHSLALLAAAWSYTRWHHRYAVFSGWLFLAGIIIFSGSLYLLSVTGLRWLGAITPIGGVAFLLGWIALAMSTRRGD